MDAKSDKIHKIRRPLAKWYAAKSAYVTKKANRQYIKYGMSLRARKTDALQILPNGGLL